MGIRSDSSDNNGEVTLELQLQQPNVAVAARPKGPQPELGLAQVWVGVDQEQILSDYVSDAGVRWQRHWPALLPTQLVETTVPEDTSCEETELAMKRQEIHRQMQENMLGSIMEFRQRCFAMARTVCELMQAPEDEKQALEEEVGSEMEMIQQCYSKQKDALMELEKQFKYELGRVAGQHKKVAEAAVQFHVGAAGTTAIASASAMALMLPLKYAKRFGLTNQVYRPVVVDLWGKILYQSDSTPVDVNVDSRWFAAFAAKALLGATLSLYLLVKGRRLLGEGRRQASLVKTLGDYKQSAARNQGLWGGMDTAVAEVASLVERLKKLPLKRDIRKHQTMQEIMRALFGMTVSINEFMVYSEHCRYFPSNVSIRNVVGNAPYERISKAMLPSSLSH